MGIARCTEFGEIQSKPGTKMVYPEPCKELRRRNSAAVSGWDCPLPTFIYPGFDCGSVMLPKGVTVRVSGFACPNSTKRSLSVYVPYNLRGKSGVTRPGSSCKFLS